MIPKRLFFIWIGSQYPEYVNFSINMFKKLNPNFDVEFIHEKTIYNSNNDFKECLNLISDKTTFFHKTYYGKWRIQNLNKSKISKNIKFSDVLRYYLIYKYGGIYLDCDTFPINPFDDDLLSNNFFKCLNHLVFNNRIRNIDIYFMGSIKNCIFKECKLIDTINCFYNINDLKKKKNFYLKYKKSLENFLMCKNEIDFKYCPHNKYIIHFKTLNWKNNNTLKIINTLSKTQI